MATKKGPQKQAKDSPAPGDEIGQGIKVVEDTSEDVVTQATKAVGTVMELTKQASKLATSLGLDSTKGTTKASTELTKEMGTATGTLVKSSVDVLQAGSDAVKTTTRIGVNALTNSITLAKDLGKVGCGLVLLTGEILEATGEIIEVSGRMMKTLGRLIESTGKIFK